ncbi:MAG: hypothetical protein DMF50_06110, partial [Acidobacteria bacterium]
MNTNLEYRPKSWRRRLIIALTAVAVILMSAFAGAWLYRRTLTRVEVPAPSATAGGEATPGVPAPERSAPANQMIRIAPERQQQIGVKFSAATIRPATVEIRAVGRVAYDETRIAHVHTKVSGWIEDVFIDFIGEPVRKGQPLFTLYSPELVSAQEEYLLALRGQKELQGSSFERVSEGSRALLDAARRRLELW